MNNFILNPGKLSLNNLRHLFYHDDNIELAAKAYQKIKQACQLVEDTVNSKTRVYGINTGFGKLANKKIPSKQLKQLQKNLILSHAAGVGDLLADDIVRLILLLKINSLARGHSGVRPIVIDTLIQFYNAEIYPCIPSQGSVGASGDLAPLAHLSAALIGIGDVRIHGEIHSANTLLTKLGIKPLELQPKEGLALINGVQASTAIALKALFATEKLMMAALTAGALTTDAVSGSVAPFNDQIQKIRGHQGQIDCAWVYRHLLQDSDILTSHTHCDRVQDPYSIRCQPQVMGACLDQMRFCANTLLIEANAVSDNPLIFTDEQSIISGGNFHGEPIAMAADNLALTISEIGALSERRIALMMDKNLSGLPSFLIKESGLNSGLMLAQVTAAALTSENKCLAHPASVDSIPTSANQEDHVSMATYAAKRLLTMHENCHSIIAIELLCAAQGIELQKANTSPTLQKIIQQIRAKVPFYECDRYLSPDISKIKSLMSKMDWPLFNKLFP